MVTSHAVLKFSVYPDRQLGCSFMSGIKLVIYRELNVYSDAWLNSPSQQCVARPLFVAFRENRVRKDGYVP